MFGRQTEIASTRPPRAGGEGEGPQDLGYLLGRAAVGDRAAFGSVYDQVAAPVYGLARAMTGDAGRSQELAAEALSEVWRAAAQYDPSEASALSWVMRIARLHVASRVRAARAGRGRQALAWMAEPQTAQPASDARGGGAQRRSGVQGRPGSQGRPGGAPGNRGAAEEQALLLALHGGFTQVEISDRLGLSQEAVAGLIRDGLRRAAADELP